MKGILYKRHIFTLLGIAIFIALMWKIGGRNILNALRDIEITFFLLASLTTVTTHLLKVEKWKIMYRFQGIPVEGAEIRRHYFHSKLVAMITPGRIGEFLPAVLHTSHRQKLASVIFADRVLESGITLLSGFVVLPFVSRVIMVNLLRVSFAVLFFFLVFVLVLYFTGTFKRLKLYQFFEGILRFLETKTLLFLIAATIFLWGFDLLFWHFSYKSIGIAFPFKELLLSFSFFNIVSFLSMVPNGIGISDIPFMVYFSSMASKEKLVAFLIILRFNAYLWTYLLYAASHLHVGGEKKSGG